MWFRRRCVLLCLPTLAACRTPKPFGVGGHDAVFDAVVDHLDEVAGAVGTAVQVALFGGAAEFLAARRARNVADAGSEGGEDGIEMLDDVFFAADHHAVAAFESPDTAAGADVDVVDFFGRQFLGAADVVDVIGIAAVDQDVAGFEKRQQVSDGLVDHRGRNHQPDGARFLQLLHEVGK